MKREEEKKIVYVLKRDGVDRFLKKNDGEEMGLLDLVFADELLRMMKQEGRY